MKLASVLHCTDNTGNTMNSPINLILDFAIRSTFVFTGVLAIVILSVRLSLGWISQKRCKIGSPNLHRRLPERL